MYDNFIVIKLQWYTVGVTEMVQRYRGTVVQRSRRAFGRFASSVAEYLEIYEFATN